ncbi:MULTISPECIES: TetR/AcrR family transcriptional regulator C-terminal domain-containing protein [Streptomyces albovinaceus subgroup]|uniref:TetR/AcrR family transcriptional regulator C-terminal domain-containing protein n=1 Tax=Streptomyces albovinaceus subgroup TaxID=1482558 RepID=UPI001F37D584|nr:MULTISPECIES: hypothetical protein [Streptomyces albovinaceus subgroup]
MSISDVCAYAASTEAAPNSTAPASTDARRPIRSPSAAVELEAQARQDTGMTPDEWLASNEVRLEQIQTGGGYPTLFALFGEEEFDLELDTLFAFGLARLLDGVAALIERSGSR